MPWRPARASKPNHSTGRTGVSYIQGKTGGRPTERYVVSWSEQGKQKTRSFWITSQTTASQAWMRALRWRKLKEAEMSKAAKERRA